MSSYAGKDFFFNYLIYFLGKKKRKFFDNSLLKDHTGYILEIIVVFVQSSRLEKNKALGFLCCGGLGLEQNSDQSLPSDKPRDVAEFLIGGNLT